MNYTTFAWKIDCSRKKIRVLTVADPGHLIGGGDFFWEGEFQG